MTVSCSTRTYSHRYRRPHKCGSQRQLLSAAGKDAHSLREGTLTGQPSHHTGLAKATSDLSYCSFIALEDRKLLGAGLEEDVWKALVSGRTPSNPVLL